MARVKGGVGDWTRDKGEVGEVVFGGDAVAKGDQFGAGFDTGDVCACAQETGDGEGEVAFAAARV